MLPNPITVDVVFQSASKPLSICPHPIQSMAPKALIQYIQGIPGGTSMSAPLLLQHSLTDGHKQEKACEQAAARAQLLAQLVCVDLWLALFPIPAHGNHLSPRCLYRLKRTSAVRPKSCFEMEPQNVSFPWPQTRGWKHCLQQSYLSVKVFGIDRNATEKHPVQSFSHGVYFLVACGSNT